MIDVANWKRRTFVRTACLLLLAASLPSVELAQDNHAVQRLGDVRTIFVGSLGDAPGANVLQYRIENRLLGNRIVSATNTPDDADAILTGFGQARIVDGSEDAQAVVRVVTKDNRLLCAGETRGCLTVADLLEGMRVAILQPNASPKAERKCTSTEIADLVVRGFLKGVEKDRRSEQHAVTPAKKTGVVKGPTQATPARPQLTAPTGASAAGERPAIPDQQQASGMQTLRIPKLGVPFLLQGDDLIETELQQAQTDNAGGELVYYVSGATSNARTSSARPVILAQSGNLPNVADKIELYRMEGSNGRRQLLYSVNGKQVAVPIPLTVNRLSDTLYQFTVGEDLPQGEYGLSPKGTNEIFWREYS